MGKDKGGCSPHSTELKNTCWVHKMGGVVGSISIDLCNISCKAFDYFYDLNNITFITVWAARWGLFSVPSPP